MNYAGLVLPFFLSLLRPENPAVPGGRPRVYLFLSETCPVCCQSTAEIRRLRETFPGVPFCGVFPGKDSSPESRLAFSRKYRLDFPLQADSARRLTRLFQARITPEVVVTDSSGRQVLYKGRIDNAYAAPGRRRTVVSDRNLFRALTEILSGLPPRPSRTEAIGCLIE